MGAPIIHVVSKLFLTATALHTLVLDEKYTIKSEISKQKWSFEEDYGLYFICNDYYGTCIGALGEEITNHAQVTLYQRDLVPCLKRWNIKSFGNTTIKLEESNYAIDLVQEDVKWKLLWLYPTDVPNNQNINNTFEVILEKNS